MKPLILIVDDDLRIRTLLGRFLTTHSYRVHMVANAAQARAFLALQTPDLIILDVLMPSEMGTSFLKDLRANGSNNSDVPAILLTAQDALEAKIDGIKSGADDYLTKPFEPEELVARIEMVLRRINKKNNFLNDDIKFGEFNFNITSARLFKLGVEIELSSSEKQVLSLLATHPNQAFKRNDLAQRIGFVISERSIDVQINRLRAKLGPDCSKYIKTFRHLGYALCIDAK